jgi:hypothetical protein
VGAGAESLSPSSWLSWITSKIQLCYCYITLIWRLTYGWMRSYLPWIYWSIQRLRWHIIYTWLTIYYDNYIDMTLPPLLFLLYPIQRASLSLKRLSGKRCTERFDESSDFGMAIITILAFSRLSGSFRLSNGSFFDWVIDLFTV